MEDCYNQLVSSK